MSLKQLLVSSRKTRRPWFYGLISAMVAVSICLSTPLPSQAIPWGDLILRGVQIFQLSNVSAKDEVALGKQMNEQVLDEMSIYDNREINSYINQIGQRLAVNSDRPNLPYTIQVVEDDAVNAFATAGGFLYVNIGLITTADNEAELASVMAHEIGHIGGKHLLKQMRQTAVAQGLVSAAGLDRNKAVALGVDLAFRRPRSRNDEFDADARGLKTLRKAGYAPSAMVSFMEKLLSERSVPAVLSTHPATKDRITRLERAIGSQGNVGDGLSNAAYRAKIRALL